MGQEIRSIAKAFINHPRIPRAATEVMIFADKDLPVYDQCSTTLYGWNDGNVPRWWGNHQYNAAGDNIITAVWNNRSGLDEIEQDINLRRSHVPEVVVPRPEGKFFIAAMGSPTTDTLVGAMEKGGVREFSGLET
jgi:hypothetical protein